MFILKGVKVLSFDTLLEVLILKGLRLHRNCAILAFSALSRKCHSRFPLAKIAGAELLFLLTKVGQHIITVVKCVI